MSEAVFDVERVRKIVEEQLTSEGIKAIIKHEVEEVAWRTITQAIEQIAERIVSEISEKLDLREIRREVVEELVSEFRSDVANLVKGWAKERVQELVEANLMAELRESLREIVEEEVRARRDEIKKHIHESLDNLLRSPIGELIRQEIGLIYGDLKDVRSRLSMLESEVRLMRR